MTDLLATFAAPYMQQALLALLLLSVVSAIVGAALNLRDLEFVSDGLVHAVFPGVVIGYLFAGIDGLYIGAVIAATVGAVALTTLAHRGIANDVATAVVLAGTFAIGVVIVSTAPGFNASIEHLLFGQLLLIRQEDILAIIVLCGLALVLVVATWKEQLFISFDRRGARAAGLRVYWFELVLNVSIALVVVAAARAIGNLLVLALLIVPVAIGRILANRIGAVVVVAIIVSVISSVIGLAVAYSLSVDLEVNASPSSVVVLVLTALYLLTALGYWMRSLSHRRRPREQVVG